MNHVYLATCENEWEEQSTDILGVFQSLDGAWAAVCAAAPELRSDPPDPSEMICTWTADRDNPYQYCIQRVELLP